MTREDAEKYLRLLGQELQKQGVTGEILVHDDITVLLDIKKPEITDVEAYLANDAEELENIDAYFGTRGVVLRQSIGNIAIHEDLPSDWLSLALDVVILKQPEGWVEYPGIRIYPPPLDYLFAIEIAVFDDLQNKKEDIKKLAKKLEILDAKKALMVVKKYIPNRLLTSKMRLTIEQYFGSMRKSAKRQLNE